MNKYPGRRWHIIRKYAIDTAANEFSSGDYDDDNGDDGDDDKSTHRMDRFPSQWWVMNQLRRSPGSPARRRRRGAGRERRRLTDVERSVLYAATFAGNGPAAAELIRMTVSKVPSKRTLATPLGVAVGRGAAGVALTIIAAGANPNMPADVPSQGTDMDDDDEEEEEEEEDAADDDAADADEDAAHRSSLRSGGIGNVGDSASNFERRSHLGSIFEHAAGLSNNQMSYITPSVAMGGASGHLAVSFANGGGGGVWNSSSSSTELINEIVYNDFDDCDDIAGVSCTRPLCVAARSLSNPACCGVLLRAGATLRHRSILQQPAERRATFVDHFPAEVAESVFYRLSEAVEGGGGGGGGGGSVVSPNALALASASANVFETVATMQPRGFRPSDIDWKTNNHGRYPAEFRAAAREVLMLMYHGQVNGGAGGAPLVNAPGVGGGGGGGGGGDGGGGGGKGDDDEDADDEEEDGMLGMFSIFRRLPEDCLRRRVTEAVVHNLSKSTVWGMMPEEFWDWNGVGRASRRDSLSLKESVGEMYAIFDTV